MGLQHASLWLCCLHAAVSLRPPAAPRVSARRRSLPSAGVFEDDAVGSCTFQLARADGADTVFDKLAERYVLIDPAKGTCCRNFCASCSFHQEDGSFLSEEKFLVEAKVQTYAYRSVEPKTHTALWAKVLFPAKKAKLEQEAFQSMFADVDVTVLDSVWNWLSDGASAVTKSRVIQQFKTACDNDEEGLSLEQFRAALAAAPAPAKGAVDYEALPLDELRGLCDSRGIKPPPVPRLMCEELRFFDANGRPGVRSKATRLLE